MLVFLLIIAYLIGSISSAILICQWLHLPDPRTQGSGNPGATNVLRFGGKKLALLVLSADFLKGFLAVILAKWCGNTHLSLIAFAVVLGHCYPIFFKFKGGKGVATAFGAAFALNIYLGAALTLTWLLAAIAFAYSSLAALIAWLLAPLYTLWFIDFRQGLWMIAITLLIIIRHKRNIQNLRHSTETKIGYQTSGS